METQEYFSKYASLVLIARRFAAMPIWPLICFDTEVGSPGIWANY